MYVLRNISGFAQITQNKCAKARETYCASCAKVRKKNICAKITNFTQKIWSFRGNPTCVVFNFRSWKNSSYFKQSPRSMGFDKTLSLFLLTSWHLLHKCWIEIYNILRSNNPRNFPTFTNKKTVTFFKKISWFLRVYWTKQRMKTYYLLQKGLVQSLYKIPVLLVYPRPYSIKFIYSFPTLQA